MQSEAEYRSLFKMGRSEGSVILCVCLVPGARQACLQPPCPQQGVLRGEWRMDGGTLAGEFPACSNAQLPAMSSNVKCLPSHLLQSMVAGEEYRQKVPSRVGSEQLAHTDPCLTHYHHH